jgi:4-hydroxy-3-methylbut-2-enyl diphosphate reductase
VEPPTPDVCYATRNRQTAVACLARQVDLVLVVGDLASSNSLRLCEVAEAAGTTAHLISGAVGVDEQWLPDVRVVGVAAGASTPEDAVLEVVDVFRRGGAEVRQEQLMAEEVSFAPTP